MAKISGSNSGSPTYTAPEWDESAIDTLAQKRGASGLRSLRQQVNRVNAANYGGEGTKRMTLRDALTGYGTAVSNVMSEANKNAASEYATKFGYDVDSAKTAYQGGIDIWKTGQERALAEDQSEWAKELAKLGYEQEEKMFGLKSEWEDKSAATSQQYKKDLMKYGYDLEEEYEDDDEWRAKMTKEYNTWKDKYRTQYLTEKGEGYKVGIY